MLKAILSAETAVEIISVELAKGGLFPFFHIDDDGDIEVEFGSHMPAVVLRVTGQRLAVAVQWQRVATGPVFQHYYNLVDACRRAGYSIPPLVTGTDNDELLNPHRCGQWLCRMYETLYQQQRDVMVAARQIDRRDLARRTAERHAAALRDRKLRRQARSVGLSYGAQH